jgi:hypothetical protein
VALLGALCSCEAISEGNRLVMRTGRKDGGEAWRLKPLWRSVGASCAWWFYDASVGLLGALYSCEATSEGNRFVMRTGRKDGGDTWRLKSLWRSVGAPCELGVL